MTLPDAKLDRRALLGLPQPVKTSSSGSGGAASAATYFGLPIITASILHADGRRGVLSIETGLDVPDAALRTRAQQSTPRVRAAFATAAQQFAGRMLPGRAPDIDQLAAALQAAADGALGRRGARVLLGTVMAL
jgi:hypothetical protein